MKLKVLRYHTTNDYTLGMLINETNGNQFLSYTLEDEHRDEKVMGETRIPAALWVAFMVDMRRSMETCIKECYGCVMYLDLNTY